MVSKPINYIKILNYTNYLAQAGPDEHVATDHQYLSESAGYYLQYLAQATGYQADFVQCVYYHGAR